MITIDGKSIDLDIKNYANFEELLVVASKHPSLENRVITDVMLNGELFSELYPHQAEDIAADEVEQLEIRSTPIGQMALDMTQELHKVAQLMANGSRATARLFRQADDDEALEMLQDVLDVAKDFMSMLGVLRAEFFIKTEEQFSANVETFSSLLGEMTDVLQNEDWILLADLLEFEFVPVCDNWKQVITRLQADIQAALETAKVSTD